MTRLAQEWNVRYPFINWHGNKGNIGGDGAAASRYTEARLEAIAQDGMLQNLNKNVVDMQPNYSEDLEEPQLLPALFPNLLCNPNSGIGVAMACNWLPYNLHDIITKAIIPGLRSEEIDYNNIAPDFPTGGDIINPSSIGMINKTGRGSIIVDGRYKIEERNGRKLIVFYEIPYGVKIEYEEQGKAKGIIPQLRKAIAEEKINDITDVRDESSKTIRIVIEVANTANIEVLINQIYNETDLRKSYSANYVALVGKTPKLLSMADALTIYAQHNLSCIKREFEFEYDKTIKRLHILEGLIWAVQNIDDVIKCIREGESLNSLNRNLTYSQTKAILDMKLGRLSRLEEKKLIQEKKEKEEYAAYCDEIIKSQDKQKEILIQRLTELDRKYGDERRTHINEKVVVKNATGGARKSKVVIPEDVFVSMTNTGYIKSVPVKAYRSNAADTTVLKSQTTDIILLFSSRGTVYRLKVDAIKQCGSKDKGQACGALLNLEPGEKILNIFSMNTDERYPYIVGFTKNGLIKKSEKAIYVGTTQNKNGLKAATLVDDDEYIGWFNSNGDYAVVLSNSGYCLKFNLCEVNAAGKTARGVKSITLNDGDFVAAATVISPQVDSFKLLKYNLKNNDITLQKRGGKGKKIV